MKIILKYIKLGTLIDIGCANNPFPNIACAEGFTSIAMDYTKPKNLRNDVAFICGNLQSFPEELRDKQFDVVTGWAIIEHVPSPKKAFHILQSITKSGGYIFLTTPEYGSWATVNAAGKTPWFYPPEHLHLHTPKSMDIIASQNHLELVNSFPFEISPLRWILRYGIGLIEGCVGYLISLYSQEKWVNIKLGRQSKHIGITTYIFKKT